MATGRSRNDTQQHVQTYVPAYQKETWEAEASELDMSLSEFIRSMVQAGRKNISLDERCRDSALDEKPRRTRSSGPKPGVQGTKGRVESILESGEFLDWDRIVTEFTDGLEDQLEQTLQELQAEDRIRYSGRNGGYTLE